MTSYAHPSAAKQRQALHEALQKGPITTLFARNNLSIAHPAGRICELRSSGLAIRTLKAWEPDICGTLHLVAKYVLVGCDHG
jgi:hypothetical protein